MGGIFATTAIAVTVLMIATWAVSVAVRDASIVDLIWGPGFALIAWIAFAQSDWQRPRLMVHDS